MNKYIRASICVPFGFIKMTWTKIFHFKSFSGPLICLISPYSEITLDYGAKLSIGNNFKMRDGAKIRVRKDAQCVIGNNTSLNSNNLIACHQKVIIGDDVQLSPNVQIYDHDHDFRTENGVKDGCFKTSPIVIGNNVWVGANTVILRGTIIGDNAVIGAGCVVKGNVEANTVLKSNNNYINIIYKE